MSSYNRANINDEEYARRLYNQELGHSNNPPSFNAVLSNPPALVNFNKILYIHTFNTIFTTCTTIFIFIIESHE